MRRIVVLLGGIGYHCDKPLLYYARKIADDNGYSECININFQKTLDMKKDLDSCFQIYQQQVEEELAEVNWSVYDEILFISKSLGTAVAAAYMEAHSDRFNKQKIRNVYLTPLEMTFKYHPRTGMAFSGTSDPWIDLDDIILCCQKSDVALEMIEDMNHSLECGDPWRNIDVVRIVMKKLEEYLTEQ
ncbi:MAG: hypothetical protein Q4B01_04990 [Eubacteriales bacterium]|nr:hypothetical protein [Eubacteriales bacterium]